MRAGLRLADRLRFRVLQPLRADAGCQTPDEYSVIDYKARAPKALEDALALPGEDVQLAVYALLWGGAVSEALFLSVDRRVAVAVAPEEDIAGLAGAAEERLARVFDALAAGAGLPAQGADGVCGYCEARGLCRKGHWHD